MKSIGPIFALLLSILMMVPTSAMANETQQWGFEENISGQFQVSPEHVPMLAVIPNGEAIATWTVTNGDDSEVFWNHYSPTSGWMGPHALVNMVGKEYFISLASGRTTNKVMASWINEINGDYSIWTAYFVNQTGWSEPQLVYKTTNELIAERLFIGDGGQAAIFFVEKITPDEMYYYGMYFDGSSWSDKSWWGGPLLNYMLEYIIIDGMGNVWLSRASYQERGVDGVFLERFDGSHWTSQNMSIPGVDIGSLSIDAVSNGMAIVMWVEESRLNPNPASNIVYMTYNISSGLSSKTVITTQDVMGNLMVRMFENGTAFAIYGTGSSRNITVSTIKDGIWAGTTYLTRGDEEFSSGAILAISNGGKAIAIWYRSLDYGGNSILSCSYEPNSGWSEVSKVQKSLIYSYVDGIGMDDKGNTMVMWGSYESGIDTLQVNQLRVGDVGQSPSAENATNWEVVAYVALAASIIGAIIAGYALMRSRKG